MNWQNVCLIAGGLCLLALMLLRSVPRVRKWIAILIALPSMVLIGRWASYRSAWLDVLVGAGAAVVLLLAWWFVYGRKLSPPQESQIKVWTEDDPF